MKNKIILPGLLALALTLVLCTGVGPALAYFTDTDTADGGIALNMGYSTTITEDVKDLTKTVTVTNESSSNVDVFVRARAYVGGDYSLTVESEGNVWQKNGDWYEFPSVLIPGQSTDPALKVTVVIPAALADTESVNVAVVYESTPAQYNENGTAYANWNIILDTGSSSPGGSGTEGGEGNG